MFDSMALYFKRQINKNALLQTVFFDKIPIDTALKKGTY